MAQPIPPEIIAQFRDRHALLWLCQRHELKQGQSTHDLGENPEDLQQRYRQEPSPLDLKISSIYWEAIWTDSAKGIIEKAVRQSLEQISDELAIRRPVILAADPDEAGQLNTRELLPMYFPLGLFDHVEPEGRYAAGISLRRQNYKFNSISKIKDYPNRALIILGATENTDIDLVLQGVSEFAPLGLRVLIIWPVGITHPEIPTSVRTPVYMWEGSIDDFLETIESLHVPHADVISKFHLRFYDRSLPIVEDDLYGITNHFALLLEDDLSPPSPEQISQNVFEEIIKGTEEGWKGFSAGLMFPREYQAFTDKEDTLSSVVFNELEKLESLGKESNLSITLPAQNGSGITTLLRMLAFEVASRGYPSLLLRQDQVSSFNTDALAAFLNKLSHKAEVELGIKHPVPTLIIFDTNHAYISETYHIAQTLSVLGRRAVILRAERTEVSGKTEEGIPEFKVRGRSLRLAPLVSIVSERELSDLHAHFTKISEKYPIDLDVPSLPEWSNFQRQNTFGAPHGEESPQSLFWVALYFFLFKKETSPDKFDNWIQRAYENLPNETIQESTRRIAALSSFRLVTPLVPLLRSLGLHDIYNIEIIQALAKLDEESGLIAWDERPEDLEDQTLRFRHPLLAKRLLKFTDPSIEEFPIDIIWPLIQGLKGGQKADLWLADSLAYQVLRTERKGAATIPFLDKRLDTYRRIPPEISDYNKVIMHHWARSLYHASLVSVDETETIQLLQEAIEKLKRAISLPARIGRDEHPSHLYTSLGTIYYALSKKQFSLHKLIEADSTWGNAAECFDKALSLIGDNYQALVAYAFRLVERAKNLIEPQKAADEALKALSYLDQAVYVAEPGELDDDEKQFFETQRYHAWSVIDPVAADDIIDELIGNKREAGYIIAARKAIVDVDLLTCSGVETEDATKIESAIEYLRRAESEMETLPSWRTFYLLYQLYQCHPKLMYDFTSQIAVLEQLERTDFKWYGRMRFNYAVLCYQNNRYEEGKRKFKEFRDLLRKPDQPSKRFYDYWRQKNNPTKPRQATLVVRRRDSDWRGYCYIDELKQEVIFRPRHFEVPPNVGDFRKCIIRFETMGPVAVPITFPVLVT